MWAEHVRLLAPLCPPKPHRLPFFTLGYWNRYPGARSDTEVTAYTYSFDKDLYFAWKWSARYPTQPEILAYLNEVCKRHDLKKDMSFDTRVTSLTWDEPSAKWVVKTDKGEEYRARFVVQSVGLLSSAYFPKFPGQNTFKGQIYHTARFPHGVKADDLRGKRVAVIGTGSSGVQCISDLAPRVGHLTVFQRSPQYVVPSQNGPIDPSLIERVRKDYDGYWHSVLHSTTAFGFEESSVSAESVTPEERDRVFQKLWDEGGGFQYMFKGFSDIGSSPIANDAAASFIRRKIADIVKDPETVRKLTPYSLYAKRPLCCDGYWEAYNQDNVELVDARESPIDRFVENGIRTADGKEHEVEIVISATGFDAVTGNYLKIDTVGRNGLRLADHWKERPRAHMGLFIHGFPNMFLVFGPMTSFTNQPPVHEAQVDFFAGIVDYALKNGFTSVEVRKEAEQRWLDLSDDIAHGTLFPKCDSWINGANIPGKKRAVQFFMGGNKAYMEHVAASKDNNYADFDFRPVK